MKGIEKITAKLQADCDAELELLRGESETQCRDIKQAGDQAAQEEYWRLIKAGTQECEMRASHLSRTAQMEARKSVLALKQEMVGKAFDRAARMLLELPEGDYVAFLAKKAAEASMNGMEELYFSEKDMAGVAKRVVQSANKRLSDEGKLGKLSLGATSRDITGGFILKQGDIEVNCSVELLTAQLRSELASQVAGVLFGE